MSEEAHSLCNRYGAYWVLSDPYSLSDPFELLIAADLLISDVSGIIPEFLFLDKPVIFIEPDVDDIWVDSSLPSSFRCGPIITEFEDLFKQIDLALSQLGTFYSADRHFITNQIFSFKDHSSSLRAYDSINALYDSR